ncbi:type II CRISPR RNA-guided endonuclease Cas9 [Kangiella shandongensis]|uniref:type II CRISPR RNA-guided endonuclease Cas9 n=1 Tax=Kangiella shandongensis TaxID=2763258 RepID=UPI001CBBD9A0|nr:type II CRISPR RNA-guided endonuclease Cas9 [Kangiella shandongensis]
MAQPYLLSLDLGTSSIGYTVFTLDEDILPTDLIDLGVRIFSDGRDPKTKEPLAVSRRIARGIRRTRDRGQNRVRRLVKELIEFGLLPANEQSRKKVFDEICPYDARHKAVNSKVDKETLARAIFHIGRRRGFKSNRLAGDSEESDYKNKIKELRQELGDNTLGEYLYAKLQNNHKLAQKKRPIEQKVVRFRGGETEFYADRKMYKDEFARIREVQGNHHLTDEQWDALYETAFWQYPLKPVPKGKCRFYPEETRAHIDLPISHQFRIYQEVNALKYVSKGIDHELDERQRLALYDELNVKKTLSFKGILKLKDEHGSPYFPSDATFNLDVKSRSGKLYGNKVMCDLRKPEYLGKLADELPEKQLNDIIHYLIEPLKKVNDKDVVVETPELKIWLKNELPALSEEQVSKLCGYRFKRDTASVSRKFMEQINPVLKSTGLVYSDAVARIEDDKGEKFHHSFIKPNTYDKLPYYGVAMPESVWGDHPEIDKNKSPDERDEDAYLHGKIANPTVHVALNQLRVVVNQVIEKMGQTPGKIHIELTRDLKNSKEARKRIEQAQSKNKKKNDEIRKFLKEEYDIDHPHREDFQKVKLWEELGKQGARHCIFTGRTISARQLMNGEVEIEHIVPFSRCYDDGMVNKTLAFKNVNNRKGNKTPAEAFSGEEYQAILKRALASFGQGPKFERFKEDAYENFYGEEKGTMIERQINDTKYITRKAAQYLNCICSDVIRVNGRLTAVLRDVWQLNHFKDKETGHYRDDHRHHIVDAFVVGLTSRRLIQQLGTRRSKHEQSERNLYHFVKHRVDDIPHLKEQLMQALDNVYASYKPDHTEQGSMFNDTAYGIEHDEDGNQWCITRKAVGSLSWEEVFRIRGKYQGEQLLDYLTDGEGIDFDVQSIRGFTKQLKAHFKNQKAFEKTLQEYSDKTGIKKLRINVPNNSVKPIPSAPYKGYGLNGYAYCDVWQIPTKKDPKTGKWLYKYEGAFVPYAEIKQYDRHPKRPTDKQGRSHPAAKRLMRLYKDDNIRLTNLETGEIEVMRLAGYHAFANKFDLRPNLKATNDGRNFISINTVFQNHKVNRLKQ